MDFENQGDIRKIVMDNISFRKNGGMRNAAFQILSIKC